MTLMYMFGLTAGSFLAWSIESCFNFKKDSCAQYESEANQHGALPKPFLK